MFKLALLAGAFVCAVALALVFHPLVFSAFVFWPKLVLAMLVVFALLLLIVMAIRKPSPFRRVAVLFGVFGLALAPLAGCNTSPQVATDIAAALNYGCPVLSAIQAQGIKPNNAQTAALQSLALACPPNPAPTNAAVAATDLVAAATILLPLLPKAQAAEMRVKMQRIQIDLDKLK